MSSPNASERKSDLVKDVLIGIIVTVVGGVIVAYIIQDARFRPPEPPIIQTPQNPTQSTPVVPSFSPNLIVYDDFENTNENGSFNQQLWRLAGTSPNPKAYQQGGKLTITDEGIQTDTAAVLVARNFDGFTIKAPFFLEAEMAHFRENPGSISVGLYNTTTALDWGDWSAVCTLYYGSQEVSGNCSDSIWPQQTGHNYETPLQEFLPGTWHRFRIEIDPDLFKITYYIDGIEVGSHIPEEAEALKKTSFQVAIGTWKSTEEGIMVGHFDNIGIGEIKP